MTRYYGAVGYAAGTVESAPGVIIEAIVEYPYYGDVFQNKRRIQDGEGTNPNLTVNNTISIVADPYAREHFHDIRYIKWAGAFWTVADVEVQFPRLLLRLGGVYNGPKDATPVSPGGNSGL